MKNTLKGVFCCLPLVGFSQQFQQLTETAFPTIPGDYRSVNWIDYNNDQWLDMFISEGSKAGGNNLLLRNNGSGEFELVQAGKLTLDRLPSVGASWTDFDNDGDEDAFVTSWYDQPSVLYVNDGKGSLKAISDLVPHVAGYAEACAWSDINNDGLSDLYVTRSAGGGLNYLFQQQTSAFFDLNLPEKHASRGVIWSDLDNDGDSDLLVTNERAQSCDYYLNEKGKLHAFYSSGLTDETISTMSASAMDVDNDSDQDVLLVSEKESPRLFLNDGKGRFSRATHTVFDSLKGAFLGSNFADIDNDGDLDIYITAAFGKSPEKNYLLINKGNGSFERDTVMSQPQGWSYGCAFGDYDRDGFMDLAVANCSAGSFPNVLYHNSGNANHWLEISCEGTASGRSALGTKVRVKATINGQSVWQLREISSQTGYCGQNMYTAHFGLGDTHLCDSLVVEWPTGKKDYLRTVRSDQHVKIREGGSFQLELSSLTTRDSICIFMDSAFALIRTRGLHADKVDWDTDAEKYYQKALAQPTFRASLTVFEDLFNQMEDAHSAVWIDSTAFKGGLHLREKRTYNEDLEKAFSGGEAKLMATLIQNYGYIRIPYINPGSQELSVENEWSQRIQDMICAIYSPEIKGWILDLRLDGGGDMYPMITGIQQLLGEGNFGFIQHKNGSSTSWFIRDRGTWEDTTMIAKLEKPCLPDLTQQKVVVLIGQNTASSGEITALAFKGRPNTHFIGEKSGGLMTANYLYEMPFGEGILPMGILLVLAEANECDRNHQPHTFIYPDQESHGKMDFKNLDQDEQIKEAIEWLSRN